MVVHGEWPEGYVGVDGLEGDVQEVMKRGSAWSTQRRWTSTQIKFLLFCGMAGVTDVVPTSTWVMMLFCSWLVRCGHPHSSIRQYVDGVRVMNLSMGHPWEWGDGGYMVSRFKKGLANVAPVAKVPKKLAMRGWMVRKLVRASNDGWFSRRLVCVTVVAYASGTRIGHWCPASRSRAPHLVRRGMVRCVRSGGRVVRAVVTLPSTKTSRLPVDVTLCARADGDVRCCPVWCLLWLMRCNPHCGDGDPVVVDGPHLTHKSVPWLRGSFNSCLREGVRRLGLDPGLYSGISLRKGCLTDLAVSGASPLAVSKQGTHKSLQSQLHYVQADEEFMMMNASRLHEAMMGAREVLRLDGVRVVDDANVGPGAGGVGDVVRSAHTHYEFGQGRRNPQQAAGMEWVL